MLQCGKGKATTENEHRSNYITWAVAKAPLLFSTNLTALAITYPNLLKLIANPEIVSINQDANGVQARKLLVNDAPIGKPVGVQSCSGPDMVGMAAGVPTGGVFGSAAEVGAAKQRWSVVALNDSSASTLSGALHEAVQLRNEFYSGRCLALQRPNSIAYNPPFRHPTRPNPKPVWTAPWQAVVCVL